MAKKQQPNTVELGQYTIKQLPKGEFIRLKDNGPVYVRGDYDRALGCYELQSWSDANRCIYRKGHTMVIAGFTF